MHTTQYLNPRDQIKAELNIRVIGFNRRGQVFNLHFFLYTQIALNPIVNTKTRKAKGEFYAHLRFQYHPLQCTRLHSLPTEILF